jgi:regulator of protease activity HflC (stomatin/prohibitin superfamily)
MDMQQIVEMLSKMRERMDADREERKTEMQTNQAKAEANIKTHKLEAMEKQIGSQPPI